MAELPVLAASRGLSLTRAERRAVKEIALTRAASSVLAAREAAKIDAIAAYCSDLDRCFYFPIDRLDGRATIQLRLRPSLNNQQLGINWADEFAFEGLQSSRLGP